MSDNPQTPPEQPIKGNKLPPMKRETKLTPELRRELAETTFDSLLDSIEMITNPKLQDILYASVVDDDE